MSRPEVVLASHDGDGLGHARRNARIAAALVAAVPGVRITLVTGLASRHAWLDDAPWRVERVPALAKDEAGRRVAADGGSVRRVLAERSERFAAVVRRRSPDLVVVDRHPEGVDGELAAGLDLARARGAAIVLGLRDVLDTADRVRAELADPAWARLRVDRVLVYGHRHLCDHRREYGLPVEPEYCGIVVDRPGRSRASSPGPLVVSAGGGRDGARVARLGLALSDRRPVLVVLGPQAVSTVGASPSSGLEVLRTHDDGPTLVGSAGTLQMAGYNSTWETIAAGVRPLLLPRRSPRREQAIRAARLAAVGLADVLDDDAGPDEVEWMLDRDRTLAHDAVERAGVRLDGAEVAAAHLRDLLPVRTEVLA